MTQEDSVNSVDMSDDGLLQLRKDYLGDLAFYFGDEYQFCIGKPSDVPTFIRSVARAARRLGADVAVLVSPDKEKSFSHALVLLRSGCKIARSGWNGKGMWLVYQKGYPDGIPINKNTAEATGIPEGTICKFAPYIMMKTADNTFVPWLASQTDILATDWMVVE